MFLCSAYRKAARRIVLELDNVCTSYFDEDDTIEQLLQVHTLTVVIWLLAALLPKGQQTKNI